MNVKHQPTFQRQWVPVVREAIRRFKLDQRDYPTINGTDYAIDGYTVLVSNYKVPDGQFAIGLYTPGSQIDGTCDGYYVCGADGEEINCDA